MINNPDIKHHQIAVGDIALFINPKIHDFYDLPSNKRCGAKVSRDDIRALTIVFTYSDKDGKIVTFSAIDDMPLVKKTMNEIIPNYIEEQTFQAHYVKIREDILVYNFMLINDNWYLYQYSDENALHIQFIKYIPTIKDIYIILNIEDPYVNIKY